MCAPSMAQILEEIFFPQKPAGGCGDRHGRGRARDPQEDVSRPPPACASISDTARELCRAVSVSLGLAAEHGDGGGGGGECPVRYPAVAPPAPKQPAEMLKSSDQTCAAADANPEERSDAPRGCASCPYAHQAHVTAAGPFEGYGHPEEERDGGGGGGGGGEMKTKLGGYQPEHYGVRVKSEVPGEVMLGAAYSFAEKFGPGFWDGRQVGSPGADGLYDPYERHQQWYHTGMAKTHYPTSSYMKSEAAYNDPR